MSPTHFTELPPDLPVPVDDGATRHLVGLFLPDLVLPSTSDDPVALATLPGIGLIYVYPMTGQPNVPLPEGWDQIPGARGCTPQSCAYRDHYATLRALGAEWVFGLSTQDSAYQREMAARLHLPFAILSDAHGDFHRALELPTFEVDGKRLIKRLTLVVQFQRIVQVHYPVFPSDQDPLWVIETLKALRAA